MDKQKLILGHAGKDHPDAITVDIDASHHPDVVHNLNKTPWPFQENSFKEIIAHHVLEHLDHIVETMAELHRICAGDGQIYIEVPHHTSWCAKDPAHKLYFSCFAFDGYVQNNETWITGNKFIAVKKELTFHKFYRAFFLHKLFNRYPLFYERFLAYIFPAEHFKIWLKPVKN